ncbi:MAG: hypothetical protein LUD01_01755 [Clostridiales bacterium]|nr:hypothetical protein [Clostridiales bacterium]
MSNKDNGEFRHYDRLAKQADKDQKPVNSAPGSCKHCEYYQPGFKYRKCFFAECYYKKDINVFRRKPHVKDRYSRKETV